MRVVLDTNVLVSGLLRPDGPPGRILDLVLAGDLEPVYDDRIMQEYRDVLRRPRFGFATRDVDAFLDYLGVAGLGVNAGPAPVELPDAGDQPFLDVAVAAKVAGLVTGNGRHFPTGAASATGVRVFSPAEFLSWWEARNPSPRA